METAADAAVSILGRRLKRRLTDVCLAHCFMRFVHVTHAAPRQSISER
jgi:hypothetical protein